MVACDSDWDGEITVTGGTKFPFWIKWIYFPNPTDIDGIDIIEVLTKGTEKYIFRIKTYNSLVDILTVQCNCAKPCNHDRVKAEIDENEVKKLLEKFNHEFFETKNLIVTQLTGGALTRNFHVNNITKNGVINITETEKRTIWGIPSIGYLVTIAIEIDSSFITPPGMGVSVKTKKR